MLMENWKFCLTMHYWLWFTIFGCAWARYTIFTKPGQTTPSTNIICGVQNPTGVNEGDRMLGSETAELGEFPWMILVVRNYPSVASEDLTFQCGGSLIHPRVVLTAAHCVTADDFEYTIRAGEWDRKPSGAEFITHQELKVQESIIHPEYYSRGRRNDIALLILEDALQLDKHILPVCLPKGVEQVRGGCYTAGWGLNDTGSGGDYQTILQKVELPIVNRTACQDAIQRIPERKNFNLHESFVCAGGEHGKDACKGDGGGPLMCPIAGQRLRFFQVGIVAWGFGCGRNGVPGVYTDVAKFVLWINEEFKSRNLNNTYYTY